MPKFNNKVPAATAVVIVLGSLLLNLDKILSQGLKLWCYANSSSRQVVFCKEHVLKNFAKFTGKHLCQSLFSDKVAGLRLQFASPGAASVPTRKDTLTLRKSTQDKSSCTKVKVIIWDDVNGKYQICHWCFNVNFQ